MLYCGVVPEGEVFVVGFLIITQDVRFYAVWVTAV